MWGSMLFQPIATAFAGDRHYALSREGVLYAGNLIPWSAFSHFGYIRETNMIRLWSASLPGTIAFLFAPPEEYTSQIIDILQTHLRNEDLVPPPSFIEQCIFPILMTASCIVVVILIYLIWQISSDLTFIVNAVLMYALMILGGPVLLRSLLGKNIQSATIE
jgi:hypothetical protein